MKTRVISGLLMAPLLILIFLGGPFTVAGALVITIFGLREFSFAFGERKPALWALYASTGLDFVDCLLDGYAKIKGNPVFTFDKDLKTQLGTGAFALPR
jgi:hypothetical protein